jgi:hypothetical protein
LSDLPLLAQLRANGRRQLLREHDWSSNAARTLEIFNRLVPRLHRP